LNRMRGLVSILFFILFCLPRTSGATHEITKWQNNRAGAVSITLDDGYLSQAKTVKDLLNARNLKGTFFLMINSLDWSGATWDLWRSVAAQGHEIGSHTVTHPYLNQLSEPQIRQELSQSQTTINFNIPAQSCFSFAYPYGVYNESVSAITGEYYIAARSVESPDGFNFYPGGLYRPINFYAIGSFGFDGTSLDLLKYYLDTALQTNAWLCIHGHDLQDSEKVERFSRFLDELLTKDVWVDTFGTVVRYMQERSSSTLAVLSESNSEITLNLSNSLDSSIYNIPVTIRSTVPSSWSQVLVSQGISESLVEPKIENNETVVYYNAIPNGGMISLLAKNLSTSPHISRSAGILSASTVAGTNAPAQTFNVWNSGVGTLSYTISVDQGWLSCSPASGTSAGEWNAITVNYSTTALFPGVYSATISISDPAASNSPQTIPVSLIVASIAQASISRSPSILSASTVVGGNAPAQTFNVWNSGGGTLSYSITVDQGWLSCFPTSGTSTREHDSITVSYSTDSLSLGTYLATINISDPAADNSPQTIPVTLTVSSIPQAIMDLNFEEGSGTTANDTSGNNNSGILYGGIAYTTDRSVGSYALSFDGIDDRIVRPGNSSLRPNDITVSLWVKHIRDTSPPNCGGIIQGAYGYGYRNGFRILDYLNKPLAQINFGDANPVWILGLPFTLNEWSHVVLTYDHEKVKLYQNGQLAIEIPETRNINWADDPGALSIGLAQWYFNGAIDKVMIFGSALSTQQVQELYSDRWAPSRISQSLGSLSPSTVAGGNASDQTFSVWNSGGGILNYAVSADQSWLSCSPVTGTSAGEMDAITVSYSTSLLASGTYSATITISDPAASNSPQTIPVSLTVTAAPKASISKSPSSLSASIVAGTNAPAQTFNVWNSGEGTLSYSISVDQAWLSYNPSSGTSTGEQDAITVNYSTTSLFPGVYYATISISDSAASNSPQTVSVSLTVASVPQAVISRNPASLSASAVVGSNAPAQTFSVWNSGGGTLSYSIAADQGWLSFGPASGTSTGEQDAITVSYLTTSLFPGAYSATISISDAVASNSPQTIPVSLTVILRRVWN